MKIGGQWRTGHPWLFFVVGEITSIAVVGAGGGVLGPHPTAAREAGGSILILAGTVATAIFLVLGLKDSNTYFRRRRTASPPSPPPPLGPPHREPPPEPGRELPADRKVTILLLGFSGSGKTLLLASLYHCFAHGGPAGIRFTTDDASNSTLVGLATQIRGTPDGYFPAGTRAGETRDWSFGVRVESGDRSAKAFTLCYLDYAGQLAENLLSSGADDPTDETFDRALAGADVLMGVLDGAQLSKLMANGYDAAIVGSIERMLNILARSARKNIHLVISKWDLMRGEGGAYYTLPQVISLLDSLSDAFRSFRQNPSLGNLRIIPVSALGTNGFVRASDDNDRVMIRVPDTPWRPWNVQIPFYCAVPDIVRHDVALLGQQKQIAPQLAKITIAVLSLVGAISPPGAFGLTLTIPVADIIKRIRSFVHGRSAQPVPPQQLDARTAISHVLNECYSNVDTFEQQWPGSRLDERLSAREDR